MRHEIILSPEAVDDLRALKANVRATVQARFAITLELEPVLLGTRLDEIGPGVTAA